MIIDRLALRRALPRYELGAELGRGAFGLVIMARHHGLGRTDAVKILTIGRELNDFPAEADRFAAEARALATLDHPHVVRVYDYLEHDDLRLIVMEYLPGGTLRTWSRQNPGPEATCAVGLAVAAALTCAHESRVLHRDIKPDNILFAGDRTPKVGDFGIAKIMEGSVASLSATSGTPRYMAPEQFEGTRISAATDLYALGAMLYERFAGRPLFDQRLSATALMRHHLDVVPPQLVNVPPQLAALVASALEKDPARRPPSAHQFALELAEIAGASFGAGWLARSGVRTQLADDVRAAANANGVTDAPPAGPGASASTELASQQRGTVPSGPQLELPLPPFAAHRSSEQLSSQTSPTSPAPSHRRKRTAVAGGVAAVVLAAAAVSAVLLPGDNRDNAGDSGQVVPTGSTTVTASPVDGGLPLTPTQLATVQPPGEYTYLDSLSPDGTLLSMATENPPAVGGWVVTLFDTATGAVAAELRTPPNTGLVYQVAINRDNSTAVVATYGYLYRFDLADLGSAAEPVAPPAQELAVAPAFSGIAFLGVSFLGDGGSVATVSTDFEAEHRLVVINVNDRSVTTNVAAPNPQAALGPMVTSPDASKLAMATGGDLVVWDVASWTSVAVPAPVPTPSSDSGYRWFALSLAWADTSHLVTCLTQDDSQLGADVPVSVDVTAATTTPLEAFSPGAPNSCAVSVETGRMALRPSDSSSEVVISDLVAGRELARFEIGPPRSEYPVTFLLSRDGQVLAVWHDTGITMWSLAGG